MCMPVVVYLHDRQLHEEANFKGDVLLRFPGDAAVYLMRIALRRHVITIDPPHLAMIEITRVSDGVSFNVLYESAHESNTATKTGRIVSWPRSAPTPPPTKSSGTCLPATCGRGHGRGRSDLHHPGSDVHVLGEQALPDQNLQHARRADRAAALGSDRREDRLWVHERSTDVRPGRDSHEREHFIRVRHARPAVDGDANALMNHRHRRCCCRSSCRHLRPSLPRESTDRSLRPSCRDDADDDLRRLPGSA
jgi:hypothetical protein